MWTGTSSWSTHLLEWWDTSGAFAPEMSIAPLVAALVGSAVAVSTTISVRTGMVATALCRRNRLPDRAFGAPVRRW